MCGCGGAGVAGPPVWQPGGARSPSAASQCRPANRHQPVSAAGQRDPSRCAVCLVCRVLHGEADLLQPCSVDGSGVE